jgi:hypothetical protein
MSGACTEFVQKKEKKEFLFFAEARTPTRLPDFCRFSFCFCPSVCLFVRPSICLSVCSLHLHVKNTSRTNVVKETKEKKRKKYEKSKNPFLDV